VVMGLPAEWGVCSRTVTLNNIPYALACQKDIIAVGLVSGDTIILNAITGSQVAVLSGHDDCVNSLTFSLDGSMVVSGSDDQTAKLWDIQTGGVIKTYDHTSPVSSVSISPDNTTLASGCWDGSINLWGIWTGAHFCTIDWHSERITSVSFSPTQSQHLISASRDHTIRQWDTNGCQAGPTHEGKYIAFSLDGTHFVSWRKQIATVQDSQSGVVITRLQVPSGTFCCCCFSPSGELIAGAAENIIYVWDITSSGSHLLKTFVGHFDNIAALTFSSCLISVSDDRSAKFWQIGTSSADPVSTAIMPTPPTSVSIEFVSMQARNGIVISCDSDGVVKTWDILTGLCKSSIQTPATVNIYKGDAQLIEGRLIVVWHAEKKIHIWDTEKNELLQTVDSSNARHLRISGDGSTVFCLTWKSIQSWSMWTGEAVGTLEIKGGGHTLDPLITDGSKIWVVLEDLSTEGWDFGNLGSSPTPLSNTFPDRPHLDLIFGTWWWNGSCRIKNMVTGNEIFHLVGRYAEPYDVKWNGQYLVAGYMSGEVLVLDFDRVAPL